MGPARRPSGGPAAQRRADGHGDSRRLPARPDVHGVRELHRPRARALRGRGTSGQLRGLAGRGRAELAAPWLSDNYGASPAGVGVFAREDRLTRIDTVTAISKAAP